MYDTETELYYLQSRYYNPSWGRFINADGQLNDDLFGNNQFAYCGNNPVLREDFSGNAFTFAFIATCGLIGGLSNGLFKVITNVSTGRNWNEGVLGAVAGGITYGVTAVLTGGNTVAASYASAFAESMVNNACAYNKTTARINDNDTVLEPTHENIDQSARSVILETVGYGSLYAATSTLTPKNFNVDYENWFQPRKFSTCFNSSYVLKVAGQANIQNGILWGINTAGAIGQELYKRQKATMIMP